MKAIEFKSSIKNKKITIPKNVDEELLTDRDVKVIILFEEANDSFDELTVSQFLTGYDEVDAIYDEA
ncbi:hypothetical protein [Ekhidna sp.]|uniref:hypothetical protein n=1 Tax=Ekhidna sp. TaxID=2608089 RepID=UPI003CCB796A